MENTFSTRDPQFHASRRRLLASPISDSSLTRMEPLVNSKVHLAISQIAEEMKRRGVADVFKWWMFMATDIIGELTFGESFRMLESGEVVTSHHREKKETIFELANASTVEEPVYRRSRTARLRPVHPNSLSFCSPARKLFPNTGLSKGV